MDYTVSSQTYFGSVAAASLFTDTTTLLLSAFGSTQSGGTLSDDNGTLNVNEEVTLDGKTYTVLGSGTVQPGADVLGVIVPLGDAVDVIILEDPATGELVFVYPDGEPNFLGAVALIVDVQEVGYDLETKTPLCFVAGTLISTPRGYVEVEALNEGDFVRDILGNDHEIIWMYSRKYPLGRNLGSHRLRPVRFAKNALGPGVPFLETYFSPQHRLLLRSAKAELMFGTNEVLLPAKSFVGWDGVTVDHTSQDVEYFHILCADHAVLLANGIEAETLLPDWNVVGALPQDAVNELLEVFPELRQKLDCGVDPFGPVLRHYEALALLDEHPKAASYAD